ncbi:MAG TPA: hypothetical protein VGH91_04965 [Gammaproteobacteria bacterium]
MHRSIATLLLFLATSAAFAAAPAPVQTFNSEDAAQVHCPLDKVVWLEPKAHLYYYRSSKHYANSGTGGFVCRAEAIKAGAKAGK